MIKLTENEWTYVYENEKVSTYKPWSKGQPNGKRYVKLNALRHKILVNPNKAPHIIS